MAEGEPAAIVAMLQLLLGCALQGDDQARQIAAIMALPEQTQSDLRDTMQEIMMLAQASSAVPESPSNSEQDRLAQENHTLRRELALQNEKLEQAERDASELRKRMAALEAARSNTDADARQQEVLYQLKTELTEAQQLLAHERGEAEAATRAHDKVVADLRRQLNEHAQAAESLATLRDEMEELRVEKEKVPGLERRLAQSMQRLEELRDVQAEMKQMTRQREADLAQMAVLEEQARRTKTVEARIEQLQHELEQLEGAKAEAASRAERATAEARRLRESVAQLQEAKQRAEDEKRVLSEELDEIKQSRDAGSPEKKASSFASELLESSFGRSASSALAPADAAPELARLQGLVDDMTRRTAAMQVERQTQISRILDLEAELEAARTSASTGDAASGSADAALRRAREEQATAARKALDLQAQLDDARQKQAAAERSVLDLRKDLSVAGDQSAIGEARRQAVAEMEGEMTRLRADNATLAAQLQKAQADLTAASVKIATLEEKVTELNNAKMNAERQSMEQVNRLLSEKDELQARLLQLTNARLAQSTSSGDDSEKNILQLRLEMAQQDKKFLERMSEKDRLVAERDARIQSLESELAKARSELTDSRRTVGSVELLAKIDDLKAQLKLEEQKSEAIRAQCDREVKLVSSAWYEMAMEVKRFSGPRDDKSFLSRQRHALFNRPGGMAE